MKSRTFHVRDTRFWKRLAACKEPPRLMANECRFPAIGEFLRGAWPGGSDEDFVLAGPITRIVTTSSTKQVVEFWVKGADQPVIMRGYATEESPIVSWSLYGREGDLDWAAIRYYGNPDHVVLIQEHDTTGASHGDHRVEQGELSWQWIREWLADKEAQRPNQALRFPVQTKLAGSRTIVLYGTPPLEKVREILSDALIFRDLDHQPRPQEAVSPTEAGP